MTREDRIKQGILSLDTGDYQALVSDYLTRSLGYTRVIALGMMPGTHKTRAGTPDTFFHTGSHCTLMEAGTYTRKGDAERKIRKDVKKCVDYRDEHPELTVDGIVIAYTCTSVDPPDLVGIERDNEGVELLGLDTLAFGLLRYPWLVKEHLQIPMPSDQVLDIDTFVSKIDRDPYSPRMSNRMVGRETEIHRIRQCMVEHKSVLIFGQSGTGKTKLALGAVVSILKDAPGTTAWCVRSLKRDLYTDMQIALEGSERATILVDDIDRVVGLRPFLELCREHGARVLATVRSSVLDEVKGEMRVLGDVEEMGIAAPDSDELHAILCDSFGIRSIDDRTAILSKSRGNLRFAQLVAEALEEGRLELANDPHELVASVYGPLLSQLDELQMRVLEVLALLGAARLEDKVLGWLLGEWGLDSRRFLAACHALSRKELVSLTSRDSAASVVEQNLTDFLIYRTLFEKRRVVIVELLEHGVGAKRLCKYVEVLCGVYRSEQSVKFVSGCVREMWDANPRCRAFLCERMGFLLFS